MTPLTEQVLDVVDFWTDDTPTEGPTENDVVECLDSEHANDVKNAIFVLVRQRALRWDPVGRLLRV